MEEEQPTLKGTLKEYKLFLAKIKDRFFLCLDRLQRSDWLGFDLLATGGFTLFWLWFAWQHGFQNSPDSWYRGLLGKSIVEGHPYFVNIKQGWLYDFGPWHHDASHSPLLPAIYALFFLFFGYRIIISNLVVSLSAGLLLFPLLRLGRRLLGSPYAGFLVYLLVAFNNRNDFLFEVFAGLSIPVTLMLLAFFLYFLARVLESEDKKYLWGGVVSLAAFYYIRPGEQVVFVWLLFWSLVLARKFLAPAAAGRLQKMWLWAALLALPWFLRNLILFRQPFFSHTTPALFTDRGYDYWTYHEHLPLPTAASYFSNHSFIDFLNKIFVQGPGNFLFIFGQSLYGPLWAYLLAFVLSFIFVIYKIRDGGQRFFFLNVGLLFLGYSIVYSLVPVLDKRYMMPPFFLIALTVVAALFYLLGQLERKARLAAYLCLFAAAVFLNNDFWLNLKKDYLIFSYNTQDDVVAQDPLVIALKDRKISPRDVILAPFADAQRLNFATGLTVIEEPDNLTNLLEPAEFFRRYRIRYSLVDVSRLLPPGLIEKMELAGGRVLFTINLDGVKTGQNEIFVRSGLYEDREIKATVRRGVLNKLIFIDSFHADEPAVLSLFGELGMKAFVSYNDFVSNKDKLFQCGLLLMQYGQGKKEMTGAENVVIK
ncbi:MAG: hypothetical protein PHG97_07000, partial [Candidatus Margulisbacteria bacterium]|nr:hypothetical protein [Candidatus Margulisiibacteriota bacterium]